MRESYKYENGKVKIIDYDFDENRKIIEKEYQDNIEDILDVENEIEYLGFNISSAFYEKKENEDDLKKIRSKKRKTAIISLIVPNLLAYIINYMNIDFSFNIFNKFITSGITEKETLVFIFSSTLIYYSYKMVNYSLKERNIRLVLEALNLNIEMLEELLTIRKNKLKVLNALKEKNNEKKINDNKYINIDYKEKLKELREELIICIEIAARYDELLNYYNNNCLEEYLSEEYNKNEIEIIKKYYKNKVKRK